MNQGREFSVTYKSDKRTAYLSRLDGDKYLYTSTSRDNRTIYTSHVKTARELARWGIDVSRID